MKEELLTYFSENGYFVTPEALEEILSKEKPLEFAKQLVERVEGPWIKKEDLEEKKEVPKPAVSLRKPFNPEAKEIPAKLKIFDEYDMTGKSTSEGKVEDFVALFRDRFEVLGNILRERGGFIRDIDLLKKKKMYDETRVMGLVSSIVTTKNGHRLMEIEDETGSLKVLFPKSDRAIVELSQNIIPDEVIGIEGKLSKELFIAKQIFRPDIPMREPKRTEEDIYVALLSDTHIGSKLFMEKQFGKFIEWINGAGQQQELAGKVKYITIAGDMCVTPDTEVVCNPHVKPISDVKLGERVLTHKGRFKKVKKKYARNYNGELVKVTLKGSNEAVLITPNHPVLGVKTKRCRYRVGRSGGKNTTCAGDCKRQEYASYNRPCLYKYYKDYKMEWIPAGELSKYDLVAFPIPQKVVDKKYVNLIPLLKGMELKHENGFIELKQDRTAKKRVPEKISLTNDVMRLIGYYLAEGSLKYTKKRGTVSFNFHRDEQEYIKDVKGILKRRFNVVAKEWYDTKTKSAIVYVHSKIVAAFFKLFEGKKLPELFLFLPLQKQKELIKGLWYGDGCTKKQNYTLSNTSKELVYQVKVILLRLGVVPNIYGIPSGGKAGPRKKQLYGVEVCGVDLERMSHILDLPLHPFIKERKRELRQHAQKKEDHILIPIREVENIGYKGKVHNLEVEGDNSYVTKTMAIHNCDGVGIYPSQEEELDTNDIFKQYEQLHYYLQQIPEYIEMISIPGNHDAVRVAEPQPALSREVLGPLASMKNFHCISSPGYFSIHDFEVMMYHGASIHGIVPHTNNVNYEHPETAITAWLKRRHLHPVYGEKPPIVPEKKDYLAIRRVPDLLHVGDIHRNGYVNYRGVIGINSGCWQSVTPYQIKLGHHPTPCILPLVSLRSGKITILKFGGAE